MLLNAWILATLLSLPLWGLCFDLDSIFDEIYSIDHDFNDMCRVLSQQVFRMDDSRPVDEVRKSVESAAQGLKAVSEKIRYDSTIDDSIDVMEAFCDDMEFFMHTQMKAADLFVFKAHNMRDAVKSPALPDAVVELSAAYDRYATQMIPLVRHCDSRRAEDIYVVKSTLHRALIDLKPSGRRAV
ncbi:hypothetical protein C2857_002742 [Epichloe festucae Fl1]|uniref:Uncharacterized protein n=1 Tax=Epichloe festucae (strain Fl1) TaxID=877507 RepID=A0A7U3Q0E9_EPIFF|nr:hypothetical protein C2857_002742 [Epichloe festucae Fl1]